MKKSLIKSIVCGAMFLLAASAFAAKPKLSTEVASMDKHGNLNLAIKSSIFYAKGFGVSDIVSVTLGKFKFDAPVGRNYSDVDEGSYLLRINGDEVSLAINMGNLAQKSGAAQGTPVTIKMKESRGNLINYQKRILNTSDNRSDFASDEIFANFREVKLGKMAGGKIYRSASPVNGLSRAEYAARLTHQANPSLIINVDNDESFASSVKDPFYAGLISSGKVCFLNLEASLTDEKTTKKIKEGFTAMLKNDGPCLIHGKEGKLRTGFMVAILGALSGATIEEINQDFMVSYENYNGVKKGTPQYEAIVQTLPTIFEKINGGKKVTDSNLQSLAVKYLTKDVGLSKAEVESLQKKLQ